LPSFDGLIETVYPLLSIVNRKEKRAAVTGRYDEQRTVLNLGEVDYKQEAVESLCYWRKDRQ
jgi:hypothetical protein